MAVARYGCCFAFNFGRLSLDLMASVCRNCTSNTVFSIAYSYACRRRHQYRWRPLILGFHQTTIAHAADSDTPNILHFNLDASHPCHRETSYLNCFIYTQVGFHRLCYRGNSNNAGPSLYLDGSRVCNWRKSDVSVAFLMNVVPVKPKPKASPKVAKVQPEVVATHEIVFDDLSWVLNGKTLTYSIPYLIEIETEQALSVRSPLFRVPLAWQTEVSVLQLLFLAIGECVYLSCPVVKFGISCAVFRLHPVVGDASLLRGRVWDVRFVIALTHLIEN